MSLLRHLFEGNKRFRETYLRYADKLPSKPRKKLAILTCHDTRLNPIRIFHINVGDAIILRNAGNQVTSDVIRSLVVWLREIEEIAILGHTDCSLSKISPIKLALTVQELGGSLDLPSLLESNDLLRTFADEEANVKEQVTILRSHSIIPATIPIHGILFNVTDGRLRLVVNGYKDLAKSKQKSRGFMPALKMPSFTFGSILKPLRKKEKT